MYINSWFVCTYTAHFQKRSILLQLITSLLASIGVFSFQVWRGTLGETVFNRRESLKLPASIGISLIFSYHPYPMGFALNSLDWMPHHFSNEPVMQRGWMGCGSSPEEPGLPPGLAMQLHSPSPRSAKQAEGCRSLPDRYPVIEPQTAFFLLHTHDTHSYRPPVNPLPLLGLSQTPLHLQLWKGPPKDQQWYWQSWRHFFHFHHTSRSNDGRS